jgi:DNA-binding MarR family transcriptional regulator
MGDPEVLIARIMDDRRQLRRYVTEQQGHPLLDLNLTMPQLKVMITLAELGATSGQDLARSTGASLATLTGIIDRLITQGLVQRREDPRDRRVRRAELTEAGATMVHRLITDTEERQQDLLRRLDQPSLEIVARAYELMLDAAARDGSVPPAPAEPAV